MSDNALVSSHFIGMYRIHINLHYENISPPFNPWYVTGYIGAEGSSCFFKTCSEIASLFRLANSIIFVISAEKPKGFS